MRQRCVCVAYELELTTLPLDDTVKDQKLGDPWEFLGQDCHFLPFMPDLLSIYSLLKGLKIKPKPKQ